MIYETVPGYFHYKDFYEEHLPREGPVRLVEIGLLFGKSACFMLETLKNRGVEAEVFLIDNYGFDSTREYFPGSSLPDVSGTTCKNITLNNLNQVGYPYNFMHMPSTEACPSFEDESVDLVFIDGAHDYDSVRDDVRMWYSKTKPGGIIAGDDYMENYPGLIRAVDEFFGDEITAQGRTWYHHKPNDET